MNNAMQPNPYLSSHADMSNEVAGGTDTTFTLNLFSSSGRIGRIRYLAYAIGFSLLIMFVGGLLAAIVTPYLMGLAYLALLYVQFMLTIKRCHDFNTSGWVSLLLLIPLVSLIFLLIPGTDGPNRFGNKTAPNGKAGVFVIIALVGIMLIGILAAIAIPSYQQYVNKAKAAQMQKK